MIGKIYVNKNIFIGKKGKYITLNDNKKKEGLASRQTLQPNYREKCIGMNYILLIIPNFVALIKLTMLRISALSGTCSVI